MTVQPETGLFGEQKASTHSHRDQHVAPTSAICACFDDGFAFGFRSCLLGVEILVFRSPLPPSPFSFNPYRLFPHPPTKPFRFFPSAALNGGAVFQNHKQFFTGAEDGFHLRTFLLFSLPLASSRPVTLTYTTASISFFCGTSVHFTLARILVSRSVPTWWAVVPTFATEVPLLGSHQLWF